LVNDYVGGWFGISCGALTVVNADGGLRIVGDGDAGFRARK